MQMLYLVASSFLMPASSLKHTRWYGNIWTIIIVNWN